MVKMMKELYVENEEMTVECEKKYNTAKPVSQPKDMMVDWFLNGVFVGRAHKYIDDPFLMDWRKEEYLFDNPAVNKAQIHPEEVLKLLERVERSRKGDKELKEALWYTRQSHEGRCNRGLLSQLPR